MSDISKYITIIDKLIWRTEYYGKEEIQGRTRYR